MISEPRLIRNAISSVIGSLKDSRRTHARHKALLFPSNNMLPRASETLTIYSFGWKWFVNIFQVIKAWRQDGKWYRGQKEELGNGEFL